MKPEDHFATIHQFITVKGRARSSKAVIPGGVGSENSMQDRAHKFSLTTLVPSQYVSGINNEEKPWPPSVTYQIEVTTQLIMTRTKLTYSKFCLIEAMVFDNAAMSFSRRR